MIAFIFSMILVIAFLFPKDKKVTVIILLAMWIMFGWSSNNADYEIYVNRYYNYENMTSQTEPLFSLLMKLFNYLNFSYEQFLIFISFIILNLIIIVLKKNTKHVNIVLFLYLIFPFCFDVVMLRYTLGTTIIISGIKYLLSDKKSDFWKYCIYVLIAALFHFSFIIMIVFGLVKFLNRKQIIRLLMITFLFSIIFSSLLDYAIPLLTNINFMNIGNKINIVLTFANQSYDSYRTFTYIAKVLIINIFAFILINEIKKDTINRNNTEILTLVDTISNLNLLLLIILPLLIYSADIFRIQLTMYWINYLLVAKYFDSQKLYINNEFLGKVRKKSIKILMFAIIYAFVGLFLWILKTPNINSVWYPLFLKNKLI